MSDSEYDEENLDDFLIKASSVLSKENHSERETIFESLKHHLGSIFSDQSEMENFFKTLNGIIFKSKKHNHKKINKQPFTLYPLVFSFNPKTSFFYVDYFLMSLQLCATEENRPEFPFLSTIFSEVIIAFYSDPKDNKNLIKINSVLDNNKKIKLYEKFLNFCNNNIKTNKKTEQSFGCLLLTEFLEKCPLSKEENNLENLFNIISEYLDDRWFECKLDLLNCTVSLIFTGEKNFKPYANKCLFKIVDYLTDEEWMKRKLAVNIVYTLLFYCKEEVLTMKDDIYDFLAPLQNDPVKEVKEVCIQTLHFLKECDPEKEEDEMNQIDNTNENNIDIDYNENEPEPGDSTLRNNRSQKSSSSKVGKQKQNSKIKKDRKIQNKLEKKGGINNSRKRNNKSVERAEPKVETAEDTNEYEEVNQQHENENENENKNENENEKNENLNEQFGLSIYNLSQILKKVQEEQIELNNMFEEVRQLIDNNYTSLNERLKVLETKAAHNPNKIRNNNGKKNLNKYK